MFSVDDIRQNWPILGAFAAGLVAWGETRLKAESAKKAADKATEDITGIKTTLATLTTHVEYSREGIDEIKQAIRDMRQHQVAS